MTEDVRKPLPKGWAWVSVGEIADRIHYGYTASADPKPIGPRLLRITDIQDSHVDWDSVPFCKIDESEKQKYLLNEGDLVFARTGATVGKSYLLKGNVPEAVFASYLIRIILSKYVVDKYVYSFFQSANYWVQIKKGQIGIGQPNVNSHTLSKIMLPLPPFNEQVRIVGRVEVLFSYLDAGVAQLRAVQAQLKRYRQAVLKAAFEGKLTQQWRQEHKDQIEPAQKLKDGLDDSLALPELPIGWAWTKLGKICESVDRIDPRANPEKEFLYLEIASIDNSKQKITKHTRYYGRDAPSRARQVVKTGDILFSTVRTYLKNIALVDSQYDKQIASTGFCVLRPSLKIKSRLLFHFVQKSDLLNTLNKIQRGTSYPAVRDSDVFEQPFPLPPLAEQDVIIEEIDRLLSVADTVMAIVENGAKKADVLRQSILKNAFEGNLVSQDPNDEPAEKLLERIKAERLTNKSRNNSQVELSKYVK